MKTELSSIPLLMARFLKNLPAQPMPI